MTTTLCVCVCVCVGCNDFMSSLLQQKFGSAPTHMKAASRYRERDREKKKVFYGSVFALVPR